MISTGLEGTLWRTEHGQREEKKMMCPHNRKQAQSREVRKRQTMSNTSGYVSFTWIHWTGKCSKEFWARGKAWRDLDFLMFIMLMCRLFIKKIYIYVKLFFRATSSTWRLGTVWVLHIKYFQHCYFPPVIHIPSASFSPYWSDWYIHSNKSLKTKNILILGPHLIWENNRLNKSLSLFHIEWK